MALSTFMILCNHHHDLFPKLFGHPQKKLYSLNTNFPFSPTPSLWKPPFRFVSMNLTILGTSRTWDHTTSVLWCLAYFT